MADAITSTTPSTDTETTLALDRSHRHDLPHHDQPLLPGLPDHISQLCLSLVHPSSLYSVCRSWRSLIYSPSFPPFLSLYALLSSSSTASQNHLNAIDFFTFDPISSCWHLLPPPPPDPPLRVLLHHPSFISRNFPIQSVAVSGNLILLAATTHNFFPALSHPLVFNPLSKAWTFGPPLAAPRRWCAAGSVRGAVYVASGMGFHYSTDTARSVEKWDLHIQDKSDRYHLGYFGWEWKRKSWLKDGRFCREAIDAVGWRGKLCMVNVRSDAAKGVVYDVEKDTWEEMPEGMLAGWRGPVAAMNEEVMYALDEGKGALRKYVPERDVWEKILESERLRGAQQIAAGGGRVCVVCRGGLGIIVVDVVSPLGRFWVLDAPAGFEAVAVHILPRMNRLDTSMEIR
ncbi:hypothetical protein I3843_12G072100 [Carya illinoinensis]|uniref:Uncharacterized protein n=1 Tax=Carya illinoinensis TaxID=32201 RepID=A0A8T1NNY9_CARIL|nr:F-box/kelch-repeat protein SKIP25-like [Carya illinoinensis]KAG2676823.1 hypothetical protein I3760_12G070200 [Carya illinoinensis]KAG6633786.1 hypothetical protein CIPAW_12G072600 [Carya illinoinensis]KAG6684612.1 hypothetical protein I3842_12G071000 [Carya illinoinensis]KAG7952707.1 hypothetical protein I3843_12G072100 [Carya illinoinensis]